MIGRKRERLSIGFATVFAISIFLILPNTVSADNDESGTFGAAFLRIPIGARIMASPDVVTGMNPDASMVFSNPAGVGLLSQSQVFLTTATWLEGTSMSAGSLVLPIKRFDLNWALGTRLLYSGGLQGLNSASQIVTEDSFYDLALTTGLAKQFRSVGLALGAEVTYLREHLPNEDGDGVTFSLGGSYKFGPNWLEAFAQDIGGDISFAGRTTPIDSRYVFGYGRAFAKPWGRFDIGTQLTVAESKYKRVQVGGAYHLNRHFTLRTGINHDLSAPDNSATPLNAGLGFHYGTVAIDYAFTSQEFFSDTHTFSLVFGFGGHDAGGQAPVFDTSEAPKPKQQAKPKPAAKKVAKPSVTVTRKTTEQPKTQPKPQPVVAKATPKPQPKPAPVQKTAPPKLPEPSSYAVVAGTHGRMASAKAETRALRLLKIPAVTQKIGNVFRVLIGRYDTAKDANKALEKFRKKGHQFKIVPSAN